MSIGVIVSPGTPCTVCGESIGESYMLIYGTPGPKSGRQLVIVSHPGGCSEAAAGSLLLGLSVDGETIKKLIESLK